MKLAEALSLRVTSMREVDAYSRQLRELDLKIQSLNWAVEFD